MLFKIILLSSVLLLVTPVWATIPEAKWESPCNQGLYRRQQITANHVQMVEIFNQDRLCKRPSFEFITDGDISYPAADTTGQQINFVYTEIQILIYHPDIIQDFNERAVCGFTDWQTGLAKTITGRPCAMFNVNKPSLTPAAGDIKFGIYKVENNRLYYGLMTKDHDSSSPDKRPTEFDPNFYQISTPTAPSEDRVLD